MKKYFNAILLSFIFLIQACEKGVDTASVKTLAVWNAAPHNAFTDLINYKGAYYCTFRESNGHADYEGEIRVIKSTDTKNWMSVALLSVPGKDLRDPHFFIDNNDVLTVCGNARTKIEIHQNIFYKLIGGNFVEADRGNIDNDYWLWSFARNRDSLYSIGHNTLQICFNALNSQKPKVMLFQNANKECTGFGDILPANWITGSFDCPCEASMVFTSDSTAVAIVRDEHTSESSHIGVSKKPFTVWAWKEFPHFVRGPNMQLLPSGKLFLAAGSMMEYDKTYYAILNPKDLSVEKIMAFPSGGDTGYPGVIIEGKTALISYYSSHEGSTRVYIDRLTY